MGRKKVRPGIALQFTSIMRKFQREDDFSLQYYLYFYLIMRLCDRYFCMTEVILCNMCIVTNHINVLL